MELVVDRVDQRRHPRRQVRGRGVDRLDVLRRRTPRTPPGSRTDSPGPPPAAPRRSAASRRPPSSSPRLTPVVRGGDNWTKLSSSAIRIRPSKLDVKIQFRGSGERPMFSQTVEYALAGGGLPGGRGAGAEDDGPGGVGDAGAQGVPVEGAPGAGPRRGGPLAARAGRGDDAGEAARGADDPGGRRRRRADRPDQRPARSGLAGARGQPLPAPPPARRAWRVEDAFRGPRWPRSSPSRRRSSRSATSRRKEGSADEFTASPGTPGGPRADSSARPTAGSAPPEAAPRDGRFAAGVMTEHVENDQGDRQRTYDRETSGAGVFMTEPRRRNGPVEADR